MIKVLIVDDEPLAHTLLQSYLERIDDVELVGNCYDGMSTINFLQKQSVDLILLDIQMPDITGIELLDSLQNNAPKIVFVTAYSQYAIDGFNYDQVVDYLLKPIRISRFLKALERVRRMIRLETEFHQRPEIEQAESQEPKDDFMMIRDNRKTNKIFFEDILYIQSWGNYLKFFLKDERMLMARKTIREMENILPNPQFMRIHKSYLVNFKRVIGTENNMLVLSDQKLPIGKSYSVMVKKNLDPTV